MKTRQNFLPGFARVRVCCSETTDRERVTP